jgi:hypothetical protein
MHYFVETKCFRYESELFDLIFSQFCILYLDISLNEQKDSWKSDLNDV